MPKATDSLFALTKTLKKSELNHIKKSLQSTIKETGEPVLLQLLNLLSKTKEYNQKEVYESLHRLRKKKQQPTIQTNALKVHKNYLKAHILHFLANNSDNKIRHWHEKLEAIQILTQRGLATEALHQIKLFKNEVETTRYRFYLTAANYYMAQVLQLTGDVHLISRSLQLADENMAINRQLYITSKIYSYYIHAFNLQLGGHLISDKSSLEKLNQLIVDPIRQSDTSSLRYEDKYFLLNAQLIVSRLEADYSQSMVYVRQLWQLIQDKWKVEALHGFNSQITFLSEYLESAFQAKLYHEMAEIFPLYKKLVEQHQPTNLLSNGFLKHFRFLLVFAQSDKRNLEKELNILTQYYRKSPPETPVIVRKRIEIDLAYGYYQTGNYKLALQYLEAIMGLDATSDIGMRLKDFLLLYSLLIYFDMLYLPERGRLDLHVFESKLHSFKRRLQVKTDMTDTRVENAFIRFFSFFVRNTNNREICIAALKKLEIELAKFEKERLLYLLQINNSINLRVWAETKQKELSKRN